MTRTAVPKRKTKPAPEPTPTPAAAAPSSSNTFDRRPDEVTIRVLVDRPVFACDIRLSSGNPYSNYARVFYPGITYVVPKSAFGSGQDARQLLQTGELEIVEADRGEQPTIIDLADTALRALVRDGKRPTPSMGERIAHWNNFTAGERSLSEMLYRLIDVAGIPQEKVLPDLLECHRTSFLLRTASEQPWVQRAFELEALYAPRTNGNGHPARESEVINDGDQEDSQ
jgi:hypothetical protein